MPQAKAAKNYYTFVAGLNTEAHDIAFPENSCTELENWELMVGGYVRRRYGVGFEQDHEELTLGTPVATTGRQAQAFIEHAWRAVGGVADRNYIVQQIGSKLYFYNDVRVSFSANRKAAFEIDLLQFKIAIATDDNVATSPVAFANGRGRCLVVGKFLEPFYLEYQPADPDAVDPDLPDGSPEQLAAVPIKLLERDLLGIEDGVPLSSRPITLTNTHEYNLINRGWTAARYGQFYTDIGNYPAKNMWYSQAFARTSVSFYNEDGIKQYSSNKLVAELFQDVSAPQGRFVVDLYKPSQVVSGGSVSGKRIESRDWLSATNAEVAAKQRRVVLGIDGTYGALTGQSVRLSELYVRIVNTDGVPMIVDMSGDVTVIASSGGGTQLTVLLQFPLFYSNIYYPDSKLPSGNLGSLSLPSENVVPNGLDDEIYRHSAVAFYAGRAWYAGCPTDRLSSRLYFSQIVEVPGQFGKCYQVADPSDINISDLVGSDGGSISIPEMGTVTRLHPFESSLLVFTETGVWEINGGFRDPFAADRVNVRRISNAVVYAPQGVAVSDARLFYAAADGLHKIELDPQAGILVDVNISEERVQKLWAQVPSQNWATTKAVYDPVYKRVWWLYSDKIHDPEEGTTKIGNGWKYDRALIFDIRLLAYFTYRFYDGTPFITGAIVPRQFCCTGEPVIKFSTVSDTDKFTYSESQFPGIASNPRPLTIYSFTDWQNDVPAFMLTGAEVLADAARVKQSPTIHTFMKRTEDSYGVGTWWLADENGNYIIDESGNPIELHLFQNPEDIREWYLVDDEGNRILLSPQDVPYVGNYVLKNGSGCKMQVRWDWADDAAHGKWSVEKEIYKQRRLVIPDIGAPLGYPTVVTREKAFGMGRAIQFKFSSVPYRPAILLGWSADFLVNQEA